MRGGRIPAGAFAVAALLAGGALSPARGAPPEFPPALPAPDAREEQRDAAIRKAVDFLDRALAKERTVSATGRLGLSVSISDLHPQRQYAAAVAGWAYLLLEARPLAGSAPRGPHLERISAYLDSCLEEGARASGSALPLPSLKLVWPLSQAAQFRAEALLRRRRPQVDRQSLRRVVLALEAAQHESGGWGHGDARHGIGLVLAERSYPTTLLAASSAALAGLGSAHRALGTHSASSIERGMAYFAAAQSANGTFPYDPSQRDKVSPVVPPLLAIDVARTAGGAYALLQAGAAPQSPVVTAALRAVERRMEWLSEGHGSATFALQHGALLCRCRGPEAWADFRRTFFDRILAAQDEDGSFDCVCRREVGVVCDTHDPMLSRVRHLDAGWTERARTYVTAIHLLVLAMDREVPRVLPVPTSALTPSR